MRLKGIIWQQRKGIMNIYLDNTGAKKGNSEKITVI